MPLLAQSIDTVARAALTDSVDPDELGTRIGPMFAQVQSVLTDAHASRPDRAPPAAGKARGLWPVPAATSFWAKWAPS